MGIVEETFVNVKSPRAEVERGFRFWDAVSVGERCGEWMDGWMDLAADTRPALPYLSSFTRFEVYKRIKVLNRRSSMWSCNPT